MFAERTECLPKIWGIVGRMDMTDPQWDRLGQFVRQRRTQLGLSQKLGGPSDTTVGKIEAGKWRPKRGVVATLHKIDTALHWAAGSSSRILAGGDPTPLPSRQVAEVPVQQAPQEPTAGDWLIDVEAGARAIKLIGDRLIAAMQDGASGSVGVVAAILADMATEYANALFAAVEENRMRELRFAEPTTAAMLAARHFQSIHDNAPAGSGPDDRATADTPTIGTGLRPHDEPQDPSRLTGRG
jgi:transcriptional regulator with XRE-family HTH domain